MFATDFLFENQRASDFGLIICSFDGGPQAASGGEIEYTTVKTPDRDKFTFYGSQLNSAISWSFSICKNPCTNRDLHFNQYEESMIAKWLLKTDGYGRLQFGQEGYEDIHYNAYINMVSHQIAGQTIGFDLVATSDCAYGFTDMIKNKFIINKKNPIILNIQSDINTYILPHVRINGTGNFYISNDSDKSQNATLAKETKFKNVSHEIVMDSDTDNISGIDSPGDFNWYFLRLVDGANIITTDSERDIEIEIEYTEPRRVIV